MSKFFSDKYASLIPYIPGEQPKDQQYIKLNTNESPFPPPQSVVDAVCAETKLNHLYSDPECTKFLEKASEIFGVKKTQIMATNGSDEGLNFIFMAFCDKTRPVVFPDITYGFYSVFADLYGVPYKKIPLKKDFSIDYRDYMNVCANVVIANPNAPTGLTLKLDEIEKIIQSNPDHVVVIDEAYIDFGGKTCVPLIDKYDNLLITQTFSKSRSLAGARLGVVMGNEALIADLNALRFSTNPYNVNRMTLAAGYTALCEENYFQEKCKEICQTRAYVTQGLQDLGFEVLVSNTNFVFAKNDSISGLKLYEELKKRGILVRHFNTNRLKEYNRITIGTKAQMDEFLKQTKEILKEQSK